MIDDVIPMAITVRRGDYMECAALGRTVAEALRDGLDGLSCYTAFIEGHYAAMFGLYEKGEYEGQMVGTVWMLGSNAVTKAPKTFMRTIQRWLPIVAEDCDVLTNAVHRDNTVHIRFLEHLGFDLNYDAERRAFIPFLKELHV